MTCTSPAVGLCYYKDHLPKLGEIQKRTIKHDKAPCSDSEKSKGDGNDDQERDEVQHQNYTKMTKQRRRVNQCHKRVMVKQQSERVFYQVCTTHIPKSLSGVYVSSSFKIT